MNILNYKYIKVDKTPNFSICELIKTVNKAYFLG